MGPLFFGRGGGGGSIFGFFFFFGRGGGVHFGESWGGHFLWGGHLLGHHFLSHFWVHFGDASFGIHYDLDKNQYSDQNQLTRISILTRIL